MDGRGEKRDGSEEERGEYFIAQVDVFASFRLSRTIRSLAHCVHLAAKNYLRRSFGGISKSGRQRMRKPEKNLPRRRPPRCRSASPPCLAHVKFT